jgi:hypothetical protein
MEALTRLVADSFARHGLDHPVDPRRLQWSRWFRCDSPHSLLVVPSKPGIFALAEEVMNLGPGNTPGASKTNVGTAALGCPAEQSSAASSRATTFAGSRDWEAHDFRPASGTAASAAEAARRMLAVLQFSEDDDMAFTLDRMFTRINPMRARLSSGKCFLRFVIIEDQAQRRTICAALNQWMLNSSEKATGIPAGFSTSLEFTTDRVGVGDSPAPADSATVRVGRTLLSDSADTIPKSASALPLKPNAIAAALNSGAAKNLHCPHPLPSGF